MKQTEFFKKENKAYGGELLKTRRGRSRGRPIDTRNSMHLVLRSSLAQGHWSFRKPKNAAKIRQLTSKFSAKYGVKILSLANVGNHLHFQMKLSNRYAYKPFIRALTSSIAMAITGVSRWTTWEDAMDAGSVASGASERSTPGVEGVTPRIKGVTPRVEGVTPRVEGVTPRTLAAVFEGGSPVHQRRMEPASPVPRKSFWDYRPFTRVVVGFRAFLNLRDYIQINQLEGLGCARVEAHSILDTLKRQWSSE